MNDDPNKIEWHGHQIATRWLPGVELCVSDLHVTSTLAVFVWFSSVLTRASVAFRTLYQGPQSRVRPDRWIVVSNSIPITNNQCMIKSDSDDDNDDDDRDHAVVPDSGVSHARIRLTPNQIHPSCNRNKCGKNCDTLLYLSVRMSIDSSSGSLSYQRLAHATLATRTERRV